MTAEEFLQNPPTETVPVYFLFGEERFFQMEMLKVFTARWINDDNRDFNFESYDAKDSAVGDWLGACQTLSFFGGTKLVTVRNLHEAKLSDAGTKSLLDYLEQPIADACLVLTADSADRKRKLFKKLTTISGAVSCSAPKEGALVSWLKKRAQSLKSSLADDAAKRLVGRVGAKPGMLASELEKLITYAGKKSKITEADVEALVGDIRLENVFALTDSLKSKNREKALSLLDNQLKHNEEPLKILGTIAWQFRLIWEVKYYQSKKMPSGKIAQAMGSRPFMIEQAARYTSNFSTQQLYRNYKALVQADRELKSTGRDPRIIMESLILNLCSG